ncbi:MAG TPA: response regulator [Planctomycetaceae bacterium]|nr:response regulator [Planctomycetaceae bacterium]
MSKLIVVVEDDEAIRFALMMRICAAGYRVETAVDGAEALEIIQQHLPDLVVMDIRMPRVDGLTALHILAGDDATRDIPVVMVSASAEDQDSALEAGAKYFLRKPFETDSLLAAIECATGGVDSRKQGNIK